MIEPDGQVADHRTTVFLPSAWAQLLVSFEVRFKPVPQRPVVLPRLAALGLGILPLTQPKEQLASLVPGVLDFAKLTDCAHREPARPSVR